MLSKSKGVVIENWIKPPKLVRYQNSTLLHYDKNHLVCTFLFPEKYSKNPFFINQEEILKPLDMFWGKRYFYKDRFYSLLEYYSFDNRLTAYYIDITLPPYIKKGEVFIVDLKVDFWVFPDKKRYIILDEDELDNAINDKLFDKEELLVCFETVSFIKDRLNKGEFDRIFKDYAKSSYKEWQRYGEYMSKYL